MATIFISKNLFSVNMSIKDPDPASIYLFKGNKRNTRKRCQICSKLTIKAPEQRHLAFLLLTLKKFHAFSSVSIVAFEQENV